MTQQIKRVEYLDPWSFYDYKPAFFNQSNPLTSGNIAPTWVGDHWRRLAAYKLLESYYRNAAAAWMDPEVDEEDREKHREYGDPYLIVNSVLSSVIGNKQSIDVEGITEEEDETGPLSEQETLLQQWMVNERFIQKLIDNERTAIKLGDAVYVLGWSDDSKRPRLRVFDPGFYFPVLDDWDNDEDYPHRVHIAWEYERPDSLGKKCQYVRRITWTLVDTENAISYPWNAEPVKQTCIMEEYEWKIGDLRGEVQDFSMTDSIEIMPPTDLGIDFIPVVHLPNTVSESDHFGTSTLAPVMQIFDDMSATDTDLQAASATTGTPPIGIGGTTVQTEADGTILSYGPGTVLETGDGRLDVIDTSRSLDALLKYTEALQDRMSVNSRTPNTLLGRVDPSKVPSGIVMTLSFQPHSNMVREMRLVRGDKYDLLIKFVCRFYMAAGLLSTMETAHLKFGSYLPADRQETANIVQQGLANHSMSIETAIALMIEAGFPIDDAKLEVARIQQQNFQAAKEALDATNDVNFVRELLGLEPMDMSMALPGLVDENGNPVDEYGNPVQPSGPEATPPAPQPAPTPGGPVLA